MDIKFIQQIKNSAGRLTELEQKEDLTPKTPDVKNFEFEKEKTIIDENTINVADDADEVVEEKKEVEPIKAQIETSEKKEESVVEPKVDEFKFDSKDDEDFYKEIFSEEEKVASESKSEKKTEKNIDAELNEYKNKAKEYEAILSDPMMKAFLEFRKSGGVDPNEFIKQTGIVGVEKMSSDELMMLDMERAGLTEEEIEIEMESFKDKSPYEKKKITNQIKEALIKERDERLNSFTGQNKEQQKQRAEAAQRGISELESILPQMIDKKYQGLKITPEMANVIKNDVISNTVEKYDANGNFVGYDVKESIRRAVILNYDKERSKALIELGRAMGAEKALEARIRTTKKEVSSASVPIQTDNFKDAVKNHSKKLWEMRGVKPKNNN